jgi:hypothetical protein
MCHSYLTMLYKVYRSDDCAIATVHCAFSRNVKHPSCDFKTPCQDNEGIH